jgi:hypothetical protein
MAIKLNSNAIVSLKNVKDYDGMTASSNDIDYVLNDIINRVSTQFETYCNRKFKLDDYTELHSGGGTAIFVKNPPVNAVYAIYDDPYRNFPTDTLCLSGDYTVVDNLYIESDIPFSTGPNSVKVEYSGGYASIPEDIKQACILEVLRLFKHRQDFDQTSTTRSDHTVTYTDMDMLPQTKKMLDMYRLRAIL